MKIGGEPPVTDLCDLQVDGQTRDRVRDLLEDLRLRRYLGHAGCPWCAGSLAAPRHTAAASSRALGSTVVARAKRSR